MAKAPKEVSKENPIPIVEGDDRVVADFFLPGCCTFDDDCNPMCITDEEMKELMIPPFAKSDYITTTKNTPVNIHAFMNDDPLFGDKVAIDPGMFQVLSNKAGRIVLSPAKDFFIYTPPNNFIGSDKFTYSVYNTVNKLRDSATVYINVIDAKTEILSQPTISVTSAFCGGASYSSSVDYIPINITPGSFLNSVFTIENEQLYPWIVKVVKPAGVGFNYFIDPSKFTSTQTITIRLVRDGAPTTHTATFKVTVVIADFDFYLSLPADPQKTPESEFEAFRSTEGFTRAKEDITFGELLLPDDLKSRTVETNPFEKPLRVSFEPPPSNTILTLENKSSADATNFIWYLYDHTGKNLIYDETSTSKVGVSWTLPSTIFELGCFVELRAASDGGCLNSMRKYIPAVGKFISK
ncbi:MAG: Ig-like domain-containing protein [Bacteroidia bacterium]